MPYWTSLPDASHGCTLLLHCGCSVACKGNWSAIELEFTVGHCASVKEIAQTMIWNLISTKDSIYIAELYSFLTNVYSVNIKVHVLLKIILDGQSSYVVPKIIATWYDYFQLHLVYYIGQFQHIIVKFLVNRDSKVYKNRKGVQHMCLQSNIVRLHLFKSKLWPVIFLKCPWKWPMTLTHNIDLINGNFAP